MGHPKKYSIEQVQELVSKFETAGQTIKEFCKANGLSTPTFYKYFKIVKKMEAK